MNTTALFKPCVPGTHTVKPIRFKAQKLIGLSGRLLESHYENNYGGAVRRLNAIEKQLAKIDWQQEQAFVINGLKREELVAANSIILHEVYFNGLGEEGGAPLSDQDTELRQAITTSFGSMEQWQHEFTAIARALAGGSGWVILAWSVRHNRLVNQWANEHSQCLAGAIPVMALDMFEHAYHIDYGSNAKAYIDAFMQNIHWSRVSARFRQALNACVEQGSDQAVIHQVSVRDLNDVLVSGKQLPLPYVLDVRQPEDRKRSGVRILETPWKNPDSVGQWASEMPGDVPIVVYCMYGLWVSQQTAEQLRELGYDARSLAGGIVAWRAMGYRSTEI